MESRMDVLSTVLKTVKLEGTMFYNAEFSAPWSLRSPASCMLAQYVSPEPRHLILYHLLTQGQAYVAVENGERVLLSAGDIVVFPHGDAHIMGNGSDVASRDYEKMLQEVLSQGLKPASMGGGGELTKFVCGYLACDPHLSKAFLSGLPPIFKVNIGNDSAGQWLKNSILFFVGQAVGSQAGSETAVAKLSEALFAETLRRYVDSLPPGHTGWLAGARDPDVGKALALLHRQPSQQWTIAELAGKVGVSRSVLAERFRHFLGVPPMAYLTSWRPAVGRATPHVHQPRCRADCG
jgi:hypothetical protein